MTSQLSSQQKEQLVPLLGSLARLIGAGMPVGDIQLRMLQVGAGIELEASQAVSEELRRWVTLLQSLHSFPTEEMRHTILEALTMRGLPEAPVLLAVNTVMARALAGKVGDRGVHEQSSTPTLSSEQVHKPAEQLSTNSPASGETNYVALSVRPEQLDWTLTPGEGASGEIEVIGGPGQITVESDAVSVSPDKFGPGVTRITIRVRPMRDGMVWSSLRLVTVGGTIVVPVVVQWIAPHVHNIPPAVVAHSLPPVAPNAKQATVRWESCEIVWRESKKHLLAVVKIEFCASTWSPGGTNVIACSLPVKYAARFASWLKIVPKQTPEATEAVDQLTTVLMARGWEWASSHGEYWYSKRFRKRVSD